MKKSDFLLLNFLESMNLDSNLYATLFEGLDTILNENFNLQAFKSLPSFRSRVQYAKRKLSQLGTGSARTVFDLGNGKVLKLAKNNKGISQNEVESDGYVQSLDCVAKVYDEDKNDLWLVSDKVDPITPNEFKQLVGISFDYFCNGLRNENAREKGKHVDTPMSDEELDKLYDVPLFSDMVDLIANMDMVLADLIKIGSYGKCNNKVLLRDAGFTLSVQKELYNHHNKFESANTEIFKKDKEYLIGGRADGMNAKDIAKKHNVSIDLINQQLKMGDQVEREHTTNPEIAHEIAKDHEAEIPDYYTRLNKMEKDAEK